MTHICVGKLTIIGSDNGLSPGRRQAIIWTNAGILLISPLGTNFNAILFEIHTFSFKKIHLKMSSGKWRPICLGLNVLREITSPVYHFTFKLLCHVALPHITKFCNWRGKILYSRVFLMDAWFIDQTDPSFCCLQILLSVMFHPMIPEMVEPSPL